MDRLCRWRRSGGAAGNQYSFVYVTSSAVLSQAAGCPAIRLSILVMFQLIHWKKAGVSNLRRMHERAAQLWAMDCFAGRRSPTRIHAYWDAVLYVVIRSTCSAFCALRCREPMARYLHGQVVRHRSRAPGLIYPAITSSVPGWTTMPLLARGVVPVMVGEGAWSWESIPQHTSGRRIKLPDVVKLLYLCRAWVIVILKPGAGRVASRSGCCSFLFFAAYYCRCVPRIR